MKARVMFATITGNNEAVANIIVTQFQNAGIETTKEDLSLVDAMTINPAETEFLVVVPYTFDLGSLPEEALDFYEDLPDLDFTGLYYAVAGSGDDFYGDDFGTAVDDFETQLALTNATRGADSVKINLNPDANDEVALTKMVADLIASKESQA
ncbi:flavodoxin domain-containing protein [Weissella ceti]|uniref:Flavodoxin domain-containing protein n=1 Tax=Weissella ceti TaxID=759620 RepID=A0ABT3E2G1_9LACO|nr:flavodoxin domain-containing protein [Weissella ceti]MCW0952590.1 flavodoxin domain-containing protein [Weissella ceti]QVK11746.1 flavodoxin domain-containing protein [Weissella ceti]